MACYKMTRFGNISRALRPCFESTFVTDAQPVARNDYFRTSESSTTGHTEQQAGQFYTLSPEIKKQLFTQGGLPKSFENQVKTFGETCIMVRQPALEIMQCLDNTDYVKPVNRYVIYGENGSGKSLSLAHVIHYGFDNGFIIVHVPWAPNWLRKPKEYANSTTRPGFVDLPLDAAAWLVHFKAQNQKLITDLDLKVSMEYIWSKRETTPAGSPLISLAEHGISRIKYSCDCVTALLKELKTHCIENRCKALLAVDGFNGFFHPRTTILTDEKAVVPPAKLTLADAFIDFTKPDWCNGAVVVTVDKLAVANDRKESYLPRYQLSKEGFEQLDPFVPVHVEDYNDKEFTSAIAYYRDRRWIPTDKEGADAELQFLSSGNPYRLMELCAPL